MITLIRISIILGKHTPFNSTLTEIYGTPYQHTPFNSTLTEIYVTTYQNTVM